VRWLLEESFKNRLFPQTLELYKIAKNQGIKLSTRVLSSVLKVSSILSLPIDVRFQAVCHTEELQSARIMFNELNKGGENDHIYYGIILDAYGKKKKIREAEDLFEEAKKKWPTQKLDILYSQMMDIYTLHNNSKKVEQLYEELLEATTPSIHTYRAVINCFVKYVILVYLSTFSIVGKIVTFVQGTGFEESKFLLISYAKTEHRTRRPH
jgi:pentatricopeptide repeat protein